MQFKDSIAEATKPSGQLQVTTPARSVFSIWMEMARMSF